MEVVMAPPGDHIAALDDPVTIGTRAGLPRCQPRANHTTLWPWRGRPRRATLNGRIGERDHT